MRTFFIAPVLLLAMAAPAGADEATLEGYGGDGALLVGVDDGESPFAGRSGDQGGGDDGNLVVERAPAETAPAPGGGAPQSTPGAPQPEAPAAGQPQPADEGDGGAGREREPNGSRSEPNSRPDPAPQPADPLPPVEESESASASSTGLPFTGRELALLLAGLLGLGALGAGMRKIAASQPHF